MQKHLKPTIILLLTGFLGLVVLSFWQVNFASADGDPNATRPSGNQIVTQLTLDVSCESGSLTVENLSDVAGEEAIRIIVLGQYFIITVPLEAFETVVIPLDYVALGISFPLTDTIRIGAQSNDMKVTGELGPCDGPPPTPTSTPTNTVVPPTPTNTPTNTPVPPTSTATNTPPPSTTPTNTPVPPTPTNTPTNTPVPPTPTNTPIPPTPTIPAEPCLALSKTLDGPFRTSDDLFLSDAIIPVAVQGENNGDEENLFYFLVTIEVENCGGTELTNVVVEDTFSNEAQPFETDDPGNVVIVPNPDPFDGMVKETLTWTVGSIAIGNTATLNVLVGTEFNPAGLLEPTSFGQSVFFNGQDDGTGSASVTADGGLSASVGAMQITFGDEISCVGSEGEWDSLVFTSGPNVSNHDKCAEVVTGLPILFTATAP
ncbi:hypothetical protein [Candidatus Leptofilum sp.]|uniref:hypothetical protein n=1 Tax=Candidatus Leptofilum sp. TaxID=3241576 RepID=UPI003B58C29D